MLDLTALREQLKTDVRLAVVDTLQPAKAALLNELKGDGGGLRGALTNARTRIVAFIGEATPGADYSGFVQTVVAEELATSISQKVVQVFTEEWLPSMSEAIAQAVAKGIDSYVRSVEVVIPEGQSLSVQLGGLSAGNGITTGFSPTGQIS